MTEPHDDLEDLLAPKPADAPDVMRESLFARTERRVAWNRRVRVIRNVVAVAAVFGLGAWAGTGMAGKGEPIQSTQQERLSAPEVITVIIPVPVPQLPDSAGPVAKGSEPATAHDVELRAELADDRVEAARLYRTAGDKYLNEANDFANAARCYRLFLSRAGTAGLDPEPGDTWLLTSLKNAAFKEKAHDAKNGG